MLRMLHKSITRGLCGLAVLMGLSSPSPAGRIERITDPATGIEKTVIHIALHDWIWEELDPVRTETAIRANAPRLRTLPGRFPNCSLKNTGNAMRPTRKRLVVTTGTGWKLG